ncbi:expressed unknown protein [Seminavis robusta]|uniref:Uncharacterized protein n=1 Tax=Seminavis robusta TaxID=568900 RepID=A0A9N8I0Q2_9STRA|nr:expressed unknown protein [Seminavis robusta]|eukprot:Sro2821_g337900.1 n/a (161) ;mRNA; r:1932-2414
MAQYDAQSQFSLQLIATVSTNDEEEPSSAWNTIEEKQQDDDTQIDPASLCWNLKDTLFITTKQCEQTHMEYARAGFEMKSFERFKRMASALVVEKEVEMARSMTLGNEEDVIMEDSIECVPKTFLQDILSETSGLSDEEKMDNDALRVLSVGELLSLLEV